MDDKRYFDILFKRYYGQLFLFARQFLPTEDDCHDAVAEVYEEVWRHYADIEEVKALSYMYRCLRRKCIDIMRHKKVEERYIRLSAVLTEHMVTQEQIEEAKRREVIVEKVLNSLDPPTKEIFTLCYVEHKRYQEVAEMLNISVSTVKKHIIRALKIVRERARNHE